MKQQKTNRFSWVALAFAVNVSLLLSPLGHTADGLSAEERAELEIQLEEARAQLDEAAERLGELHSRLYAMETVGHHGQRPMLGVLVGERGPNSGLLLVGVTPGGGAEAAGMAAGDEITSVNNVDLTDAKSAMAQLKEAMSDVAPGDAVSVGYQRDGVFQLADVTTQAKGVYIMGMTGEVDVEALESMAVNMKGDWVKSLESLENLESLEELQALSALEPQMREGIHKAIRIGGPAGGLRLESISGDLASYFGVDSGVLVLDAPSGPDGEPGPLKAGDVLLTVDGEPIRHPGDAFGTLMRGQDGEAGDSPELTLEVMRHGVREFVMLRPDQLGGGASSLSIRSATPGDIDVQVIAPPSPPRP